MAKIKRKIYKGEIKSLTKNQIFVFGSNTQGRHGAGAAKFAKDNCGAIYGQAKGLQGQSYAIVTKDLTKSNHPSISIDIIVFQIKELYAYAINNPDLEFFIAYNGNKSNLNGYTPIEMAKMFNQFYIPENIIFEEKFAELITSIRGIPLLDSGILGFT